MGTIMYAIDSKWTNGNSTSIVYDIIAITNYSIIVGYTFKGVYNEYAVPKDGFNKNYKMYDPPKVKKIGWMPIYKGSVSYFGDNIFNSKEQAKMAIPIIKVLDIIKIEWEE